MPKHKRILYCLVCTIAIMFFCSFNFKDDVSQDIDKQEKIIYLTFDDGPSVITNKVMDILKQKEVHATFFVIGEQIKNNEDIIKRIYDEGHAIGLHTYTHNHNKIYSSKRTFIKEMISTRSEINKITNTLPRIIRFPEGSRNHLTKSSLKTLHKCGFKIYDWNVVISDGLNPKTSPNKLYKEATGQKDKPDNIILLMHCDTVHTNTCTALPSIIDYYKKLGYDFRIITSSTPEQYFPITK